jgi:hypothetical protein
LPGYCQIGSKTIPRRRNSARGADLRRFFDLLLKPGKHGRDAPDPAFDHQDIDPGGAAFSLCKVNLFDLASRIHVEGLGWIALAVAVTFLQIFLGVLRWREISAECGARPRRGQLW